MKYKYVKGDTKEEKMRSLTFGDLKDGDIFVESCSGEDCLDGNLYGTLYIKVISSGLFNAVNLADGYRRGFLDDTKIKYYTGEIEINTSDFVEKVPVGDEY